MDKNTQSKLDKIFTDNFISIVNSEIYKNKYYLDLKKDDTLFSINFTLLALQQTSAKSLEKQIMKKYNKKNIRRKENEICNRH